MKVAQPDEEGFYLSAVPPAEPDVLPPGVVLPKGLSIHGYLSMARRWEERLARNRQIDADNAA
jgi:hypothetical protein